MSVPRGAAGADVDARDAGADVDARAAGADVDGRAGGADVDGGDASAGVEGRDLAIRPATPDDVPRIHALIVELAEYERAPEQVTGTPELLAEALFGTAPSAEAIIAQRGGEVVGMAVFHGTFSTWECRPGIWLEDLYVPPPHRRDGVGGVLLAHLAGLAVQRGATRLEWHALDWNEPALSFYERLGAARLSAWELHRLDGESLRAVAAGSASRGGSPPPADPPPHPLTPTTPAR